MRKSFCMETWNHAMLSSRVTLIASKSVMLVCHCHWMKTCRVWNDLTFRHSNFFLPFFIKNIFLCFLLPSFFEIHTIQVLFQFYFSSVSDPKAHYTGTEPWKPKEALEDGIITDKADIFAYGLTLWEMMTLSVPHLEMLDTEDDDDNDDGKVTVIKSICYL